MNVLSELERMKMEIEICCPCCEAKIFISESDVLQGNLIMCNSCKQVKVGFKMIVETKSDERA